MAIFEQYGRMTYIDPLGDQHILYPTTKKECVEGLSEIENAIGDLSQLETEDKSSLVAAVNEARLTGSSNVDNIQEAINAALEDAKSNGDFNGRGIVSIIRTAGDGSAGSVDTYTITYTDDTTTTFSVYNGANGTSGESSSVSGENGATFTPYVDSDGNLSWSNDKGLGNPATVNIKGPAGDDGYTPIKGKDYFDGEDGYTPVKNTDYFDGVSCTHAWDGTTLSVTSASGTSSANLIGPTGATGENGVSITKVEQTTTSDVDGGTNIITITLSNGQSFDFNVKNGSTGSTGATGDKGDKGDTGETGAKGDTGDQGLQGDPGENATINGVTTLTLEVGAGINMTQNGNTMTISANYEYGTTDLTAGTSELATGKLYFVYE